MKFLLLLFLLLPSIGQLSVAELPLASGVDLFSTDKKIEIFTAGKMGSILVFLSASCPCSDSHIVELKDLATQFPEFSFVAVHSNTDESREVSLPYFEKVALPFPVISDHDQKLANQFRAYKTPHAFLTLPDGRIAYQGGLSDSKDCSKSDRKYLREALIDLKEGRKIRTPNARTLGCTIARRKKDA